MIDYQKLLILSRRTFGAHEEFYILAERIQSALTQPRLAA